ncbi:MAG TPA: BTAD domain-containing putative transcriptional regulator, partial [Armatimonadota bacterium]|nr:BTAD domain-containing putative transcriptional regulator [Armatimonadota bacterium]
MARLAITLLGPFAATLDGEAISAFKSHKVQALLAYLAAEADRPHARGILADLFWPHRPEREALRNLTYALSDLRRAIGDREATPSFLHIERDTLRLNLHAEVSIDALDLEACARPDRSPPEDLRRAVALYRGPFLEGLAVDSAPFEEWAAVKREQYARLALAVLRALADHHAERGEWQQASVYARRQVELDPWDEIAHSHLLRALAFSGRRHAALAHYDAFRRSLAEGLGVDPGPETAALYDEILQGTIEPDSALASAALGGHLVALSPPTLGEGPSAPFTGRQAELGRLEAMLSEAVRGAGRAAFVTGEPGSGKTYLLQEFARRAVTERPDLAVAVGRCNAYAGIGDPYLPFIHVLRALTGDLSDQWAAGVLPEGHAARLQALLPHAAEALVGEGRELVGRLVSGEVLLDRLRATAPEQGELLARL